MKAWKPFARGGRAPGFSSLGGRRNQVSRREEGVPFQKVACLGCFFSREDGGMCAAVPLNSERKAEALERTLTLCLFCVPNITEEVSTPLAKPLTLWCPVASGY